MMRLKTSSTYEQKKLRILYDITLVVLILVSDIGEVNIPKIIFIGASAVFMGCATAVDIVYMLAFTFPFLCGIPGTYIMLIALVCYVFKRRKVKSSLVLFCLFALILEFVNAILYDSLDMILIVQYMVYLFLLFSLIYDTDLSLNYKKLLQISVLGLLIVAGIIAAKSIIYAPTDWLYRLSRGWYRFGDDFAEDRSGMMLRLNANNMAYFCITGMSSTLLLFLSGNKREKFYNVIFSAAFFVIGLFSMSRSFIVVAVLVVILFILSSVKNPRKVFSVMIIVSLVIFSALYLLSNNPELLAGFFKRFTNADMQTGGGRTSLIMKTIETWSSRILTILIGSGISGYYGVFTSKIHCGLLQILYVYGVIGAPILLYFLLKPVILALKKEKIGIIYYMPWIAVVIFTQTIQFLDPPFLMFNYLVGIYAIRMGINVRGRNDAK